MSRLGQTLRGYGISDEASNAIEAALLRDMPAGSQQWMISAAFTDAYHRAGGFSASSDYGRVYNLVRHQLNDSYNWGLNEDWVTFNNGIPGGAGTPGFSEADARARWIARDNPYGESGFLGIDELPSNIGTLALIAGAIALGAPYLAELGVGAGVSEAAIYAVPEGIADAAVFGAEVAAVAPVYGPVEGFADSAAFGDAAPALSVQDAARVVEQANKMPPAQPETVETLKNWGMQETAPGTWSQPPLAPLTIISPPLDIPQIPSGLSTAAQKLLAAAGLSSGTGAGAKSSVAPRASYGIAADTPIVDNGTLLAGLGLLVALARRPKRKG